MVRPKTARTTVAFETLAKNLLRAELKRTGTTYAELAELLTQMGTPQTERTVSNKISRGGFSAAFLLQCFKALGMDTIRIRE
jgi:3-mercaptopyruvate sulfurtransferase SseA